MEGISAEFTESPSIELICLESEDAKPQENEVSNPSMILSNGANVSIDQGKQSNKSQDIVKAKALRQVSNCRESTTVAMVTSEFQDIGRDNPDSGLAGEVNCELLAMQFETKSSNNEENDGLIPDFLFGSDNSNTGETQSSRVSEDMSTQEFREARQVQSYQDIRSEEQQRCEQQSTESIPRFIQADDSIPSKRKNKIPEICYNLNIV